MPKRRRLPCRAVPRVDVHRGLRAAGGFHRVNRSRRNHVPESRCPPGVESQGRRTIWLATDHADQGAHAMTRSRPRCTTPGFRSGAAARDRVHDDDRSDHRRACIAHDVEPQEPQLPRGDARPSVRSRRSDRAGDLAGSRPHVFVGQRPHGGHAERDPDQSRLGQHVRRFGEELRRLRRSPTKRRVLGMQNTLPTAPCVESNVIIRAQVNFALDSSGAVARTFVQSWSVNR